MTEYKFKIGQKVKLRKNPRSVRVTSVEAIGNKIGIITYIFGYLERPTEYSVNWTDAGFSIAVREEDLLSCTPSRLEQLKKQLASKCGGSQVD